MRFDDLKLMPLLLQNVQAAGYETPTPIQQATIPLVLAGKDVLGCAQTGTGKTAAFALPIIQQLAKSPPASGRAAPSAPSSSPRPANSPSRFMIISCFMAKSCPSTRLSSSAV